MILSQTLHGYNDGHTLLASSVDLPADARRIMLNLSDMSGGSMERGFEEYLTGYPVKDGNLYAIAKTWYAPEMPRPGCVWTHTILVNVSDLPRIAGYDYLLSLFHRPTPDTINQYNTNITINEELNHEDSNRGIQGITSNEFIKTIIKNLYGSPSLPLFITSSNSLNFDRLFLSLWQQQWPRLRRNFSFCTGAVAPRNLSGTLLDLQVIPFNLKSKGYKDAAINIDVNQLYDFDYEKWVELAFNDLLHPSATLKRYLNFFGSDVDIKKESFQTLLQSFTFFYDNRPSLGEAINFLAEKFISAKDGVNLKSIILGSERNNFPMLPQYEEASVIFYLATTKSYKSFNYSKLNFAARFYSYFQNLNGANLEVLKETILKNPNPLGEEAITNLALTVNSGELNAIWRDRQLSTVFIGLNPRLTFNSDFWLSNANNQQEIIHQLQRTDIGEDDWKIICNILVDTGSNIDPELISKNVPELEKVILDKINDSKKVDIGQTWVKYIRKEPVAVLEWMNESHTLETKTINILIEILDPNAAVVIRNGMTPWLIFLQGLSPGELTKLRVDIHVFCLALAFNIKSEETQEVFALTFEKVYFAIATDSINYALWRNLEIHTKPLSWLKDWDKCKKLIIALVDHFLKNKISIRDFLSNISNEELRDRISKQYKKSK